MIREKDPNLSTANFRSWNEKMAQRYNPHDFHTKSIFLVRWIEQRRSQMIIKLLQPCDEDRILEIGSGGGNLMELFRRGSIFGLDLSDSLLRTSKQKRYNANCHFIQAYGTALPFADHTFEKIYCSEVLEHVPNPQEICREAHRVLKTAGVFVVSVPNERVIDFALTVSRKLLIDRLIRIFSRYPYPDHMTDEWHLHHFDGEMLRRTVAAYFSIEKMVYIPSRLLGSRIVALCRKLE